MNLEARTRFNEIPLPLPDLQMRVSPSPISTKSHEEKIMDTQSVFAPVMKIKINETRMTLLQEHLTAIKKQ